MVVIKDFNELNDDNKDLDGKVLLVDSSVLGNNRRPNDIFKAVLKLKKQVEGIILNYDIRSTKAYSISGSLWGVTSLSIPNNNPFDNEKGPIMAYSADEAFQELKKAASEKQDIYMSVDYNYTDTEANNVIGVIPGIDEDLKYTSLLLILKSLSPFVTNESNFISKSNIFWQDSHLKWPCSWVTPSYLTSLSSILTTFTKPAFFNVSRVL